MREPKTMEDAILQGQKMHIELPRRGTEAQMIKIEVADWLWKQLREVSNEIEDPEIRLLELMKRITK